MIRSLPSLLRGLGALVLLSACQLPLPDSSIPLGKFFIQTSSSLGVQDGGSRTILPTVSAYHYTVDLTGTATLSFTNLTALTEPFQAPLGPYTLKVTLYNGANEVIGVSADLPITVDANPALNQFSVMVSPSKTGTGTLQVSYTWPATAPDGTVLADAGVLKLLDLGNGSAVVDVSGFSTVDTANQTAGINGAIPSGTYLLSLTLSKTVGGQPYTHPTLSEVVQIYDNLVSSKVYTLSAAALNGPPAAPTAFSAIYSGSSFDLSWTMPAGTHSGFRLYRNGVLIGNANIEQTTFYDLSAPALYAEVFEIAAYNDFGESTRVAQTVNLPPLVPETGYALTVGYSETLSSKITNLALSWTNPGLAPVTLYRASQLSGPYTAVYTGTGDSFLDTDVLTNLLPGTTYYYAIAPAPGRLLGLPVTTLVGSISGISYPHVDPVAGVVSGTTMAWDAGSNTAVPVLGVPYLAPDTTQIPSNGLTWMGPELPVSALLAGGYTYWVWGKTSENSTQFVIGAFDSSGVIQQTYSGSARYITALAVSGTDLVLTHQETSPGGPTQTFIPWNTLAWFQPTTYAVTIDFQVPTAPVITLETGGQVSGVTLTASNVPNASETLTLDPQIDNLVGYYFLDWTIDGLAGYPTEDPFEVSGKGALLVRSEFLDPGVHEAVVRITDGVHIYSANFTVTVVFMSIPQ